MGKKSKLATSVTRGQLQLEQQVAEAYAKLVYIVRNTEPLAVGAGVMRTVFDLLPTAWGADALSWIWPSTPSEGPLKRTAHGVLICAPIFCYSLFRFQPSTSRLTESYSKLVTSLFSGEIDNNKLDGLLRIIINSAIKNIDLVTLKFDATNFVIQLREAVTQSAEYQQVSVLQQIHYPQLRTLMKEFIIWQAKTIDFRDKNLQENEAKVYLKFLRRYLIDNEATENFQRALITQVLGTAAVWLLPNVLGALYNGADVFNAVNMGRFLMLAAGIASGVLTSKIFGYLDGYDPQLVRKSLNELTTFMNKNSTWQMLEVNHSWLMFYVSSLYHTKYREGCYMHVSTKGWNSCTIKDPATQRSLQLSMPPQACTLLLAEFLMRAGYQVVSADNQEVLVVSTPKAVHDANTLKVLSTQLLAMYNAISNVYSKIESFTKLKKHLSNSLEFTANKYYRHGYPPKIYLEFTFKYPTQKHVEFNDLTNQIESLLADYHLRIKTINTAGEFKLIIDDMLALYRATADFDEVISGLHRIVKDFSARDFSANSQQQPKQLVDNGCQAKPRILASVKNDNNAVSASKPEQPSRSAPTVMFFAVPLYKKSASERFFIKKPEDKLPAELAEQVTLKISEERVLVVKLKNFHKVRDKDNEYICLDTQAKHIIRFKNKNKPLYDAYKEYLRREEGPAYAAKALGENGILSMKKDMKKVKLCNTDDRPHGQFHKNVVAIFEDGTERNINITVLTECKTHQQLNRR